MLTGIQLYVILQSMCRIHSGTTIYLGTIKEYLSFYLGGTKQNNVSLFATISIVFSSLLIQCLILFYRTLSEYNFPQFPETLRYLYKLSVEGPRRSEDTVIVVIFLTEVSFVDCEQLCSHFLFLLKFKSKFQFLIFLPLNVGPYQDLRS